MKQIDISTEKYPDAVTFVDETWEIRIKMHKWYAMNCGGPIYAVRREGNKKVLMHRLIIDAEDGMHVDHINGNSLDNQKHNLRVCTNSQNRSNSGKQKNNTSGYKGVTWNKGMNKWRVAIQKDKKTRHIGCFFCLVKAARAYDEAAKKYHGEYAMLNFPVSA